MKKLLIVPLLLISLISSATVYYIDPAGKNTNNGSSGSPWNTLAYASSKATASGDIIHVNAGSYTITSQIPLSAGVSIEGDGNAIFTCTVNASDLWGNAGFAVLLSGGANSAGQHISGIKMDGSKYAGWGAIGIWQRNNVTVSNCTITNFSHWGVRYFGGEPPAAGSYMTGCSFHDNTVTDCAGYYANSLGCLGLGGIDGMTIYNNTIIQPANRGVSDEGEPIYGVEGFLKNVKIYNNTISKTLIPSGHWDFAIEIWNWQGGNEIYNNNITGSIDLSGATKGSSTYSVWVHDNIIGQPSLQNKQSVRGILFECIASDVIIERNLIHHVSQPIFINSIESSYYGSVATFNNDIIRYNVFDNVGAAAGQPASGWGVYFSEETANARINNWRFYNNTIVAATGGTATCWGISLPDCGTATGVTISNNIVQGFSMSPVRANAWGGSGGTSISNLDIKNNIFYNNGNSNNVYIASGVTTSSYTNSGNLITAPGFVSSTNLHLTAGKTGVFITSGLTDKDGNAVANPPAIGAFESGSASLAVAVPVYQTSVIENSSPSLLILNYSQTLANIAPPPTAFTVLVNSVTRGVSSVAVSGTKVQLSLASPVNKGDAVKVTYTVPATNPLQIASGEKVAALTTQTAVNNVTTVAPVAVASQVVLTINPNPLHRILNAVITYTSPLTGDQVNALQIFRIFDVSGRLLIEKLLIKSTTSIRMPVNLRPGVYVAQLLISGLEMATQKIIVY
jgi:uncharacterized repeat protein (TIGR02059 family)